MSKAASADVLNQLKGLEEGKQEIKDDVGVLKIEMQGARADIRVVKANQSDARGYLENHSQRLESIEQKQDAHTELLGHLINIGEETKTTMATKDDIAAIKATQDLILQLLQKRGE